MAGLDLTQMIVRQIPVPDPEEYAAEILFDGVCASMREHIIARVRHLYQDDVRMDDLFENIKPYPISPRKERKKVIAELDRLIGMAYGLSPVALREIAEGFDKYYTKIECMEWF